MTKESFIGKTFNSLTVLEEIKIEKDKGRHWHWKCKCDCGNEKIINKHQVTNDKIKSCGCAIRENLLGKKFGRLEVIKLCESIKKDNKSFAVWLCRCECGTEKEIKATTLIVGDTNSCGCLFKEMVINRNKSLKGDKSPFWKGGKHTDKDGYVKIYSPDHPNASQNGYVREHIKIMSDYINRPLNDKETVHHKNGQRADNRLSNLELWASNHPSGQRVEDLVIWAKELLNLYDKPPYTFLAYKKAKPS